MGAVLKPMLAENYDPELLTFPVIASPKLDGYRAFVQDGKLLTRNGKEVGNEYTKNLFSRELLNNLDGELIVGEWNDPKAFHNTSGPVRRATGEPDVCWHVFDDRTNPTQAFTIRLDDARRRVREAIESAPELEGKISFVPHSVINSLSELDAFESEMLVLGFEGVMIRKPSGPYKFGRSTVKEGYLLKVKRIQHEEGVIIRLEEQMHNMNESFKDELGRTKRSEDAAGMVPSGMVGAFWMKSPKYDVEFKVSAGSLTHAEKKDAWEHPEKFIGELGRYKFFPHGTKDAPRHGIFDGLRGHEDVAE